MPEFLSAAWFDLLGASLPPVAEDLELCIDYAVGDARYRVRAHAGALLVEAPDGTCDLTLSVSAQVAADLASGRVSPRAAIRAGEVRVSGDLSILAAAAALLAPLTSALATVKEATTYP